MCLNGGQKGRTRAAEVLIQVEARLLIQTTEKGTTSQAKQVPLEARNTFSPRASRRNVALHTP